MEVRCSNCGTMVSHEAAMCYACGARVERNPYSLSEDLLALASSAGKAMDADNWSAALAHYNAILAQRPDIAQYWVCAGLANGFMGNKDKQWECLCNAVKAEPNNPEPWEDRLEFIFEHGRDKLQAHIDEYFRQFGMGAEPLLRIAESIIILSPRDIELAIRYINSVYNADPKNKSAKKLLKQAMKIQKRAR